MSSFPNELLQSEYMHSVQVGDKSVATSRLDITNDDLEAYYASEGKEFFGSLAETQLWEEQLLKIQQLLVD